MRSSKIIVVVILVGGLFCGYGGLNAQENESDVVGSTKVSSTENELWEMMRDSNMITSEQYQHVLSEGCLPTGSIVQNSPVAEEKQELWTGLAVNEVITPEELAYMFFNGTLPDMTERETKAFENLAPVYEPNKQKRLTYDLRKKHAMVDLIRFSKKQKAKYEKEHQETLERAREEGISITGKGKNGGGYNLIRYETDMPVYYGSCNVNSATTISTDKVRPGSGGSISTLTGTNVLIGVLDFGQVYTDHQEFGSNRVNNVLSASANEHTTAVAGTLIASGVNSNAMGMAPKAEIEVRTLVNPAYEVSDFIWDNEENNPWISNHSYDYKCGWHYANSNLYWRGDTYWSDTEDFKFGLYTADQSYIMDLITYMYVYHLPIYAAGNDRLEDHPVGDTQHLVRDGGNWVSSTIDRPADGGAGGYDTLNPFAVAKNILTVGAIRDLTSGFTSGMVITGAVYSSCGPTDDGRIKPDVVASGESIYTTATTGTNSYQTREGTSFAAPAVAGSAALLQSIHQIIVSNAAPLWASSLKGVIIHTADDADGIPGPDYRTGWGVMNTEMAAHHVLINDLNYYAIPHIKECTLIDGRRIEFQVTPVIAEPLIITTCWTDPVINQSYELPYGLDLTNSILLNDLDIRIISPNGVTNYPWVLDPFNPTNTAVTGDNVRDNVEQVYIQFPSNGTYTVIITHKGILQGVGSNGVQDVSIIISGINTPTVPTFAMTETAVQSSVGSFEWPSVVGALYAVQTTDDLLGNINWVSNDLVHALTETLEWTAPAAQTNATRFYQLQRLR